MTLQRRDVVGLAWTNWSYDASCRRSAERRRQPEVSQARPPRVRRLASPSVGNVVQA